MKSIVFAVAVLMIGVSLLGCQKKEAKTLSITTPAGETASVEVK